jgi:hypothetical protein
MHEERGCISASRSAAIEIREQKTFSLSQTRSIGGRNTQDPRWIAPGLPRSSYSRGLFFFHIYYIITGCELLLNRTSIHGRCHLVALDATVLHYNSPTAVHAARPPVGQ